MKELIEQEVLRQGYTIIQWEDPLKYGWGIWGIAVVKDGFHTVLFVDEIVSKILERELR